MWPIILTILAGFITYYLIIKPHQHWKKLNVPHPSPLPVVGNLGRLTARLETLHHCVQRLYDQHDGRMLGIYFFNTPVLILKDPNLIKQLGIKDFDHFVDHRQLIDPDIDPLFGNNLFSLSGQKWREMRATLSPAFTSSKMKAMFVLISECAKQLTEHYETLAGDALYDLELKDTFTRLANDIIATTAFGIQCNSLKDKDNDFYLMGKDITDFSGTRALKIFALTLFKPVCRLFKMTVFRKELGQFFKNIIISTIQAREKEGIVRPDMIHLLMEARKGKLNNEVHKGRDEDAGFATVDEFDVGTDMKKAMKELSDDEITAQALIFFLAGFDTISTAMCNMGYELAQHPYIQERLQKEIDQALQSNNGKVTYELVMKLNYLDMVLSETLRKWPPLAALDRVCNDTYTIEPEQPGELPVKIEKGDIVWYPCFPIHRDPQYYPDPELFNPERFSDENKGNIDPMTYMPFGVGPRNCIGSRFALMEAKVTFVHLLSKFSLVLTNKSEVPLEFKKGLFNLIPKNGFWIGLKKRTST